MTAIQQADVSVVGTEGLTMVKPPRRRSYDDTALAYMLLGGHGVVSVTANIAPKDMAQMCAAALRGDLATARSINQKLMGLHSRLFVEANPIPVKWALSELGLIRPTLRLPLTPLAPQHHDTVRAAMREAGLVH